MGVILQAINNKYFLWALVIMGALGILQVRSCQKNKYEDIINTYKRQLSGELSDKEKELQMANHNIGVMESELMSQKELNKRLKYENEEYNVMFSKYVNKHNLKIKSKDRVIAKLNRVIKGGKTIVEPIGVCDNLKNGKCAIRYTWEDDLSRFKLIDPDIFTKNNETFESEQIFKVYGEVWEQKNGSLQVRRLVLREVYRDKDGKYRPIEGGEAKIIDSKFDYRNEPNIVPDVNDDSMFKLRLIAVESFSIPLGNNAKLALGVEFFNIMGIGINTNIALDFGNIYDLEPRLGVSYNPTLFNTDLNFAFGVSIGTPINNAFKMYSANIDFIFYLNN